MAATFRQNNGLNRDFSASNNSLFAQDDWKISRRVTLNLGLRWELNPPYISAGDVSSGRAIAALFNRPARHALSRYPGIPDGIAPTIYTNFAPCVGIAYDVFGNGKTAIRAGYGVFYAVGMINLTSNLRNQPFIVDVTLNGTPNLVAPGKAPAPILTR